LEPAVEEHNVLFKNILTQFNEFGPLNNIDPDFKSRLYEKFLKKSISQKNWGQFFTPRNVVKAIIEMSDIEKLQDNSIVHDPACGVGGFILEEYLGKRSLDYYINSEGNLSCKLRYIGHDRDPQTVILAKANMLIHLSQLLRQNPTISGQFAFLFNTTFKSYHASVLGSLSGIPENVYDLLMTNPPYVMAGSKNYKKYIHDNTLLRTFYKLNVGGVEGLFLVKIIKGIKKGGSAFIIVPDGMLLRSNDVELRNHILESCVINAIISLPVKTFYSSIKKTYILSITKKMQSGRQKEPVFTYLVTKTGETLDAKRFPDDNDLPTMVRLYKYFMADRMNFTLTDPKCRIQPISRFYEEVKNHWAVDRWWTQEERRNLGILEEPDAISLDQFAENTRVLASEIHTVTVELEKIEK
jgi:type I restriction-modification system DNA methylase subunit